MVSDEPCARAERFAERVATWSAKNHELQKPVRMLLLATARREDMILAVDHHLVRITYVNRL